MRQFLLTLIQTFVVFVVQEAIISQFRLPGGGFSLLLIFSLVWAILSSPEIAALTGFTAGFFMDLSQSASGPIGHWTLLMIAACYAVSYLGSGNESLSGNPLGFTFLTMSAVFFVELSYVVTSALLGVQAGSFGQVIITLVGVTIWSLVATPIFLPLFSYAHSLTFSTRSTI